VRVMLSRFRPLMSYLPPGPLLGPVMPLVRVMLSRFRPLMSHLPPSYLGALRPPRRRRILLPLLRRMESPPYLPEGGPAGFCA
jgi:hypothetical protein